MTKRHSMSPGLVQSISEKLQNDTLTNEDRRSQVLLGKFPSQVLYALKIRDLDIVTSVSVVAKIMTKHSIPPELVSDLHRLISAPLAVYDSASQKGSIVVLSMEVVGGNPLIASIIVDTKDAYKKGNMHWLSSAYPKDNHNKFAQWESEGLLRWKP